MYNRNIRFYKLTIDVPVPPSVGRNSFLVSNPSSPATPSSGTVAWLHGECKHWHNWSWWRHQMETFSASLAICAGNSPVNFPHKDQWRGALMFSLICVWINGWVNNREFGDLRRYRNYYYVTVMFFCYSLEADASQEFLLLFDSNPDQMRQDARWDLSAFCLSYLDVLDIVLGMVREAQEGNCFFSFSLYLCNGPMGVCIWPSQACPISVILLYSDEKTQCEPSWSFCRIPIRANLFSDGLIQSLCQDSCWSNCW